MLEVTDAFCPWNEGRYRAGAEAGPTEDAAELRLSVADLASAYLGAFSLRAARGGRSRRGAGRRRDRPSVGALPHRAAAVLPRAVLTAIKVRTCKSVAEFKDAVGAISEYGAWEIDDETAERFLRVHPLDRMHAAFEGKRAVGGAGAFPFDFSVPGGSVACAGVTVVGVYPTHRRRGDPDGDDASAARGDARARRADRRALGIRRADLRALRLRPRVARRRDRAAAPARRRSPQPFEARGTVRYVEPDEVPSVLGPIWEHVLRERPACSRARRTGGSRGSSTTRRSGAGGAGPKRFAVVEVDGARGGLRDLPPRAELGGWNRRGQDRRDRGARARRSRPSASSGATCSTWSGRARSRRGCSRSTIRCSGSSPSRGGCACASATVSGCGSSTSARRSSARSYSAPGPVVFQVADGVLPVERRHAGSSRTATAKKTRAEADLACDVTALGSVYLGGFTFAQLVRGGRVEELKPGAAARADAMFRTDVQPWCPEIF